MCHYGTQVKICGHLGHINAMAHNRKTPEFAIQIILHLRWQLVSQIKLYFKHGRSEGDKNVTISYEIASSRKSKDGGVKKFQSNHRADDFEKLSARAKICRPQADGKGHY